MKRYVITLFTLALCGLVSSQAMSPANCREFPAKSHEDLTLKQQVEADILKGHWTVHESDKLDQFLHFEAAGKATRHQAFQSSSLYTTSNLEWKVEILNHEPVLTLKGADSPEGVSYLIEQTCDGIVLTQLRNGLPTAFAFAEPDITHQKERLKQLAGLWVNTRPNLLLHPRCQDGQVLRIEDAEVRYTFNDDGTFHKAISSRSDSTKIFEETGSWEVSKDGKHLILHQENESGEKVSLIAQIKHLELDELVLSTPVASMGLHEVAELDADLFFNKN